VSPVVSATTKQAELFSRQFVLLLAIVVVVGVVAMPGELYPGDPFAMREEARAILLRGEYALTDSIAHHYGAMSEFGQYVVDHPRTGRAYSKYGSMAAWFYVVPMAVERMIDGGLPPLNSDRRLIYLNVFNIVLSVLAAASLYRTALRFRAPPWTATAFVVACFYTTFVWNYLRAQNSEIMQLLLFSWATTAFLDAVETPSRRLTGSAVLRMWCACTALLLMKVAYILVGPLFGLGLVAQRKRVYGISWPRALYQEIALHALPAVVCLAVWALNNHVKFGAPWLTGYHAWRPEVHGFNGRLADSLPQLFFSVQWGFAACFPVLLLAMPWIGRWLRREPFRYGTLAGIAVTYVGLVGMLPSWRGEWCYGPRYWMFILPFVSLPAIDAIRWLASRKGVSWITTAAVVCGLCYSTWLQWQVNRWPFFTYYDLRTPLERQAGMAVASAFCLKSYGKIQSDMYQCRDDLSRLEWWADMKEVLGPDFAEQYELRVREAFSKTNLFWWQQTDKR